MRGLPIEEILAEQERSAKVALVVCDVGPVNELVQLRLVRRKKSAFGDTHKGKTGGPEREEQSGRDRAGGTEREGQIGSGNMGVDCMGVETWASLTVGPIV